jgi:hypothetical protein
MRYKEPALPQAGSARRAASRRGVKTQRRRASGSRPAALPQRECWFRKKLSGESPSSLKQDIKRTTDSLSACLSRHSATELTVWNRTTRTSQSSSFAGRVSDKEFSARTLRLQRDSCDYSLVNPAVLLAVTELGEKPRRLRSNRNSRASLSPESIR